MVGTGLEVKEYTSEERSELNSPVPRTNTGQDTYTAMGIERTGSERTKIRELPLGLDELRSRTGRGHAVSNKLFWCTDPTNQSKSQILVIQVHPGSATDR